MEKQKRVKKKPVAYVGLQVRHRRLHNHQFSFGTISSVPGDGTVTVDWDSAVKDFYPSREQIRMLRTLKGKRLQ